MKTAYWSIKTAHSTCLAKMTKSDEVAENAGQKVEVKGTVEESSDGTKTIAIESYKVME